VNAATLGKFEQQKSPLFIRVGLRYRGTKIILTGGFLHVECLQRRPLDVPTNSIVPVAGLRESMSGDILVMTVLVSLSRETLAVFCGENNSPWRKIEFHQGEKG
jgi:hypothetical protein